MVGVAWTWRGECERSLSRRRPARSQTNREWSARGRCDRRKHTQTHHCGGFVLPSRFHVCCSRCRWHSPHETCREKKAAGVGEEEKREGVRSCSEEAAAAAPLSSPRRSRFRNSGSPSLRCRRSSGGRATPMLHEHQRDDQHCVTYLHVICLVPQLQLQLRTAIR